MNKESSIEEYLKVLENALEQKKREINQQIFTAASPLWKLMGLKTFLSINALQLVLNKSKEVTEENIERIRRKINRSPWEFLTKIGLIGLGIGVMLGTYYKSSLRRKGT